MIVAVAVEVRRMMAAVVVAEVVMVVGLGLIVEASVLWSMGVRMIIKDVYEAGGERNAVDSVVEGSMVVYIRVVVGVVVNKSGAARDGPMVV